MAGPDIPSALTDLVSLTAFTDDELAGVPSAFARRDLQQDSVVTGARIAGDRFKTVLEVFDEKDFMNDPAVVDRVAGELAEHSGRGETVDIAAEHLKNYSLSDAPSMNAANAPAFLESFVNAVNVATMFTTGDIVAHVSLQSPTDPPAYYAGKWSVVAGMLIGGQTYWGRGVFSDAALLLWQARIAAMMTIEYYVSFIPTIEAMEPWTAVLWNEAPGAIGNIDRLPVSEADELKLLAGLGHMVLLIEVLHQYPPAPRLPKLDLPLPGENYQPTFSPFTNPPGTE